MAFVGIIFNLILLGLLFAKAEIFAQAVSSIKNYPVLALPFIIFSFFSIEILLNFSNWRLITILFVLTTYGMDTGAWFFGRKFGSRKLWPSVSPNKTVEGLIGGMFTSGFLSMIFVFATTKQFSITLFFIFSCFGGLSQLGDLFQSKFKRLVGLKDSSSLIPGHGGVYDRIDSLIFLAPFFALFCLKYNPFFS